MDKADIKAKTADIIDALRRHTAISNALNQQAVVSETRPDRQVIDDLAENLAKRLGMMVIDKVSLLAEDDSNGRLGLVSAAFAAASGCLISAVRDACPELEGMSDYEIVQIQVHLMLAGEEDETVQKPSTP